MIICRLFAAVQSGSKIRVFHHSRNQQQVNQLADEKQPECQQPDHARHRFLEIETVNAAESEDTRTPQQISSPGGIHAIPSDHLVGYDPVMLADSATMTQPTIIPADGEIAPPGHAIILPRSRDEFTLGKRLAMLD